MYQAIVDKIPSESVIVGLHPIALIRETSRTFLGVPSGLVSSQIIKTRQEVESALKLNEEEYCRVLDDIYGVNQI